MIRPIVVDLPTGEVCWKDLDAELPAAGRPLEIEIGFGKGRYLLRRAQESPERSFLGIEAAAFYYSLVRTRARRRGLDNLTLICGEARHLISSRLALGRAEAVHLYFPDPWPKSRHQRRRLMDPTGVDLVLALMMPGGRLFFATDHPEYGESVVELLQAHPAVEVAVHDEPWPDGARTNYETKYEVEGRPILRLIATLREGEALLHPAGVEDVVVGWEGFNIEY